VVSPICPSVTIIQGRDPSIYQLNFTIYQLPFLNYHFKLPETPLDFPLI
jgi:hypothetical protein